MHGRHGLLALIVWIACTIVGMVTMAACTRPSDDRCAFCGMKLDAASPWRTDLLLANGALKHFDTPRCALAAWRTGRVDAKSIRVLDYYEHHWLDGTDVLFVLGSDVVGPMGPDLVPVDRAHAQKFTQDHTAARPLPLDAITPEILAELR